MLGKNAALVRLCQVAIESTTRCLNAKQSQNERDYGKHFDLETFRSMDATPMPRSGFDMRTVQHWMGQELLETTMRYLVAASDVHDRLTKKGCPTGKGRRQTNRTPAKLRQAEAIFITRRTSDTSRLSPVLRARELPGELTMRIEKAPALPQLLKRTVERLIRAFAPDTTVASTRILGPRTAPFSLRHRYRPLMQFHNHVATQHLRNACQPGRKRHPPITEKRHNMREHGLIL
jgi:hypothetical protein